MGKEKNWLFHDIIETLLLLFLYGWVSLASIINLGSIAPVVFLVLMMLCALYKPRTGLIALISMFYLPIFGLGLPSTFVIASAVVFLFNFRKINRQNYRIVKSLIKLYFAFLLLRSVSFFFVENINAFQSYLFVSFSVLIHLLVIPALIKKTDDIKVVLRFWGFIGALSAILGFIHFQFQDIVYLRKIFTTTGAFDKSTVDGSFDFVRWIWAGAEPNFTGLQLLIPFVINLSLLFKDKTILSFVITAITFLGILGTYSRTTLIVSLLVTAIYVILSKSHYKYIIMLIIPLGYIAVYMYFPEFIKHALTIQEVATSGQASGRFPLYEEAINNFLSNPLFGIGTGQTATVSSFHLESHNLYLQSLGENGFFSLLIILIIFGKYLITAFSFRQVDLLYFIAGLAFMINACTISVFDLRLMMTLFVLFYLNYSYKRYE